MKTIFPIAFLIGLFLFSCSNIKKKSTHPIPTNGKTQVFREGEENENFNLKNKWKAAMHQAAPGVNWQQIESKYALKKQAANLHSTNHFRSGDQEHIANDKLVGTWYERGSTNQAGSIYEVEYDKSTDELYILSAGGSIFKGKKDGSNWQVVNDKIKFDRGLLKFIPTSSGRRMLALSQKKPYFSDDDGLTWTPSKGVKIKTSFAKTFNVVVIDNDGQNQIYLVSKPDYWDKLLLYKSIDNGENFTVIYTFESYEEKKVSITNPHNTKDLFILTGFSGKNLSQLDIQTNAISTISNLNDINEGFDRVFLTGTNVNNQLTLLTYSENNNVYRSIDNGITWKKNGKMPDTPWNVGIYVSKYNAGKRYGGSIDCFTTTSLPTTWDYVNRWWDYYDDIDRNLHADIMAFHEFESKDGTPFMLVSSHGGLHISYDNLKTRHNIGLSGLNVSQYYDVVTDYSNPNEEIIYVGAQDQGFQKGFSNASNPMDALEFEQLISGDYGHIVLTDDNAIVWKMYPDGSISATDSDFHQYNFDIESQNETVWIPPMTAVPNENAVYVAGGNVNGGAGSYIIKLKIKNIITGEFEASQLPYDFIEFSGSEISAIAVSPFNPDVIYVATNNSLFFYSHDRGKTFTQSLDPIPGAHYLYGSVILPSKLDSNVVYMAGSGYSNPPVFKSIDQGKTFQRMDTGMPPTLVYDMAFNEDESLLFAGTESAPYVYVVDENKWYDMSGKNGPNQIYWSVEYIPNKQKVRFGTYGRGIWDFQIQEPVSSKQIVNKSYPLNVYPNPVDQILHLDTKSIHGKSTIKVVDILGKTVFETEKDLLHQEEIGINLSNINTGRYILIIQNKNQYFTAKFIKK